MKIFNWMNRKFGSKDGRHVKKDDFVAKETDKKPLIENVGIVDVIDVSWSDGLLTIGTLGFDQLQKLIPEEEYFHYLFPDQNGEESENDDDEFLAEDLFGNSGEVYEENLHSLLPVKTQMPSDLAKYDRMKTIGGYTLQHSSTNETIVGSGFKYEEKEFNDGKKKKVTLAELFSAETDEERKGHKETNNEKTILSNKSTSGHSKHSLSSVKKLIPRAARVDSRLAHKLNRMVTRVLKRKIHPDPASQGKHQQEMHNETDIFGHQLCVQHAFNETVSLLPTRDVEV